MIEENTIDAESTREITKNVLMKERVDKRNHKLWEKERKEKEIMKVKARAPEMLDTFLLKIQQAADKGLPSCKIIVPDPQSDVLRDNFSVYRAEIMHLLRTKGYSVSAGDAINVIYVDWVPWYKWIWYKIKIWCNV